MMPTEAGRDELKDLCLCEACCKADPRRVEMKKQYSMTMGKWLDNFKPRRRRK